MPSESPTRNERNARFIQQFRHRKIISRERGDFFAATFHRADRFNGNFEEFILNHG